MRTQPQKRWHRTARLVVAALFLFFGVAALVMWAQGDTGAAHNAMSIPFSGIACLWFLGVPYSDDD